MEEYISSHDEADASPRHGGAEGGAGRTAEDEVVVQPEPASQGRPDGDADNAEPSSTDAPTIMMEDASGAAAGDKADDDEGVGDNMGKGDVDVDVDVGVGVGVDEDEDEETDSPVFLTAVSHTTEVTEAGDAVGGEGEGEEESASFAITSSGPKMDMEIDIEGDVEETGGDPEDDVLEISGGDALEGSANYTSDGLKKQRVREDDDDNKMEADADKEMDVDGVADHGQPSADDDPATLEALANMEKPVKAAGRRTSTGRLGCALDGCDRQQQGPSNHFFCKKHGRMWRELNRYSSANTKSGGASTDGSASVRDGSTRKRKLYDEVVVVEGGVPVPAQKVSARSSKRDRKTRKKTKQQEVVGDDGQESGLLADLSLSIEDIVKSSPRKAGAAAAAAVSRVSRSRNAKSATQKRSSHKAGRPPLIEQVVRLTAEGRKRMGESRLIQGMDPQLYFVLVYDEDKNHCELVPMRITGQFRAEECKEFPASIGRAKWMLHSENDCKDQKWEVSGDLLEVVQTAIIANSPDADDEQWDVLEAVSFGDGEADVSEVFENKDQESPPLVAKFRKGMAIFAKEDDGVFYKSKVKKVRYNQEQDSWDYYIHFVGWGERYDKWTPEHDIVKDLPPGEVAGPVPNSSPAKKKKKSKKQTSPSPNAKGKQGDTSSVSTGGTNIYATKCNSYDDGADVEAMLQVDRILGRRWNIISQSIEFLTVWRGFPDPSEYTWEPESNFSLQSLSIFRRMWGKDKPPPGDGEAEMLSENDIKRMKAIQDGTNTEQHTSTPTGSHDTSANPSECPKPMPIPMLQPPSPAVRRSTRTRSAVVQETTETVETVEEEEGKEEETDEVVPASEKSPARAATGVVWTPVNECILLLTALEHPEDLVSVGPGLWMVTKSEWLFEGTLPTSDRQIRHHFEEMLRRKCDRMADTSAINYGRHVLNFALASAPPSAVAKNMALVAAGWYRIAGGRGLDCNEATWYRPVLDLKSSYCRLSEKQTKEGAISLDIAWKEHEQGIRDAIEEAWVPSTDQGDEGTDIFVDIGEDIAEEEHDDSNRTSLGEEEAVSMDAPDGTSNVDRITMVGVRPRVEYDERADLKKFKKLLMDRKDVVLEGDPRPSLTCAWCGPKNCSLESYSTKAYEQVFEYKDVPATCKGCKFAEECGWRFHYTVRIYSAGVKRKRKRHRKGQGSVKAVPPEGTSKMIDSVKAFLRLSSPCVSQEFSKNHILNTPKEIDIDEGEEKQSWSPSSKRAPAAAAAAAVAAVDGATARTKEDEAEVEELTHKPRPKTRVVKPPLPPFEHLLKLESGLVSVLASDDLHLWNAYYGTNSTVALCALRSLASGKLPREVHGETPFFRSRDELNVVSRKGGPPPTRFLGVSRTVKAIQSSPESIAGKQQYTGKFGVEFPLFDTNIEPISPKSATIEGRTVLIRNDLTEDVAGRLYAFMYRLLYGTATVERLLKKTNALSENVSFAQDTLRAFGATKEQHPGR